MPSLAAATGFGDHARQLETHAAKNAPYLGHERNREDMPRHVRRLQRRHAARNDVQDIAIALIAGQVFRLTGLEPGATLSGTSPVLGSASR